MYFFLHGGTRGSGGGHRFPPPPLKLDAKIIGNSTAGLEGAQPAMINNLLQ